jgi:hypothetical protein
MSSTLHVETRPADCSGLSQKPLDGEFVIYEGHGKAAGGTSADDLFALLTTKGANLRMVWGHEKRSDHSALGNKKTPVLFKGGILMKLSLYNFDESATYSAGDYVMVRSNLEAVGGSAAETRLLADLVPKASMVTGWCVGQIVTAPPVDQVSVAVGEAKAIEVYIYDAPRFVNAS